MKYVLNHSTLFEYEQQTLAGNWKFSATWLCQNLFSKSIFFPISVKEKCCPMSHSFVTLIVVVVMLEVVEILSYPYFSIHHVDGKIKNSTKLLEAKRFKQWGRFTNKQLFAIFDGQQISGLYSIEEEGHFELNYKS